MGLAGCATPTLKKIDVDPAAASIEVEKQRRLAVRSYMQDMFRLYRVAYPVQIGAADYCGGNVRPIFGMIILSAAYFSDELRRAAVAEFGLNDWPTVIYVIPGSPAEAAGLRPGDIVRSTAGEATGDGEEGLKRIYKALLAPRTSAQPFAMTVTRGGRHVPVELSGERGCGYPIQLVRGQAVNAFANGEMVTVTQGMMDFVEDDAELAMILGHEIAHNALHHIDAKKQNRTVGLLVGLLVDLAFAVGGIDTGGNFSQLGANVGQQAYSQDFEAEADYMGVYAAARGGFDMRFASDFWRRLSADNPDRIDYARTHPTNAYRAAAVDKIVSEIETKRVAGLALTPDTKDGSPAVMVAEGPAATPTPEVMAGGPPNASGASRTALSPVAEESQRVFVARAPPRRVVERWAGTGRRDSCGNPWEINIEVDRGKATGSYAMGDVHYDLYGKVEADGTQLTARAGKSERSMGMTGPRFVEFELALSNTQADGFFVFVGGQDQYCRTTITLSPATP